MLVLVAALGAEIALGGGGEGAVDACAGGEPLVQAEGEERLLAAAGFRPVAGLEHGAEALLAGVGGAAGLLGEQGDGFAERGRGAADQAAVALVDAEALLGPGRERVRAHRFGIRRGRRRVDGGLQFGGRFRRGGFGDALQGFVDHVLGGDLAAEESGGEPGDLFALLVAGFARGHRGAGADHLHVFGGGFFEPAGEHRYVCALAAAVEVQLVDDDGAEVLGCGGEHVAFGRALQHQLGHHVVGQQNLGRMVLDLFFFFAAGFAGVASEGDRRVGVVLLFEFFQRAELAVDQGVHRVDQQGADMFVLRVGSEELVDDRDEVGERFAGAGAGGDDV